MITISGRPISKKNSKRIIQRGKRKFIVPSKAYKQFEEDSLWLLKSVDEKYEGKIHVNYKFYYKGKMKTDVDNAIAGINDILEKAGIIDNDKNIVSGSFEIVSGQKEWRTEIKISKIIDI